MKSNIHHDNSRSSENGSKSSAKGSRSSVNNSKSNTPKNINSSLRFSDICKNFDNQMKKNQYSEQTKGLERNSRNKNSQSGDSNKS